MILTIQDNGLLALIDRDGTLVGSIVTVRQLNTALQSQDCPVIDGAFSFLCSSSIDFPEEFTTDERVIATCRSLRGAN